MSAVLAIPQSWLETTLHPEVSTRKLDLECVPLHTGKDRFTKLEDAMLRADRLSKEAKKACRVIQALFGNRTPYDYSFAEELLQSYDTTNLIPPNYAFFQSVEVNAERMCMHLTFLRMDARAKLVALGTVLMRYGEPDILRLCEICSEPRDVTRGSACATVTRALLEAD